MGELTDQRPRPYVLVKTNEDVSAYQIEKKGEDFEPSTMESWFIDYAREIFKWLWSHELGKISAPAYTAIKYAKLFYGRKLVSQIQRFIDGEKIQTVCQEIVYERALLAAKEEELKGRYSPEWVVEIIRDNNRLARDIKFNLEYVELSQEQETLIGDLNRALTVVRVVFPEKRLVGAARTSENSSAIDDSEQGQEQQSQTAQTPLKKEQDSYTPFKDVRRNDYIRKLAYIARLGFADRSRVPFSNALLDGFKNTFVSMEGEYVKNNYAKKLGEVAFVIGAFFLLIYFLVPAFPKSIPTVLPPPLQALPLESIQQPLQTYRSFLVLAAAACAGTWLSFLLRRVTLSFPDLENVDEDRLNPVIRVLFVVGLTWVIGAFIATDFIQFNIAGVKSLKTELLGRGLVAAAMGVICGISERALASVVSRRSDDLLNNLGSQRTSAQATGRTDEPAARK